MINLYYCKITLRKEGICLTDIQMLMTEHVVKTQSKLKADF